MNWQIKKESGITEVSHNTYYYVIVIIRDEE